MVFEKVAEMLANHLSIEQDSIKMETTLKSWASIPWTPSKW